LGSSELRDIDLRAVRVGHIQLFLQESIIEDSLEINSHAGRFHDSPLFEYTPVVLLGEVQQLMLPCNGLCVRLFVVEVLAIDTGQLRSLGVLLVEDVPHQMQFRVELIEVDVFFDPLLQKSHPSECWMEVVVTQRNGTIRKNVGQKELSLVHAIDAFQFIKLLLRFFEPSPSRVSGLLFLQQVENIKFFSDEIAHAVAVEGTGAAPETKDEESNQPADDAKS
jgi:hypothetical protein